MHLFGFTTKVYQLTFQNPGTQYIVERMVDAVIMFGVLHSLQLINGMCEMEKLSQIMIYLRNLNRRGIGVG
jgi:hypothetical protein